MRRDWAITQTSLVLNTSWQAYTKNYRDASASRYCFSYSFQVNTLPTRMAPVMASSITVPEIPLTVY